MSEFKPGDMVECVNMATNPIWVLLHRGTLPVQGGRYTVRETYMHPLAGQCIRLVEIVNPVQNFDSGPEETAFQSYRFRLIKPPATDIQIFRDIVREVFEGANA